MYDVWGLLSDWFGFNLGDIWREIWCTNLETVIENYYFLLFEVTIKT